MKGFMDIFENRTALEILSKMMEETMVELPKNIDDFKVIDFATEKKIRRVEELV